MAQVEVAVPSEQSILDALNVFYDKILSVSEQVPSIIKSVAILGNQDVHGEQMPPKKPRPPRNPTNNPTVPLMDTGNLIDPERWTAERIAIDTVAITFNPPEYQQYLIEKAPEDGGRNWLNGDQMNAFARAEIAAEMHRLGSE